MTVNELAERESARIVRLLSLSGVNPELVETIRVSVAAAVAFAHGEGVHAGIAKMQHRDGVLGWSGDKPVINNLQEWVK